MASVIRGSDNFDSLIHQGLGVNQTWQNVTSSRSLGVIYTNTTGKPIVLTTGGIASASGNFLRVDIDSVPSAGLSGVQANNQYVSVSALVPAGSSYIVVLSAGTISGFFWSELR